MYEAMMIAATGLQNQQRRLDTIANNVANINSAAFKSVRLDFKDALYTTGHTPGPPRTSAPEGNQQKGHGVMVAGITKNFTTGSIQRTERNLDVAIEGEGFFELADIDGELVYTRNGSFHLDDAGFLVSAEGLFVHDVNGERVWAPYGTDTVSIETNGRIVFTAYGYEMSTTLGVYTFRNVTGLLSAGNGNYSESIASGERRPAENAVLRQGMLEMSNVGLAEEMTRLIRTQRVFQLASRGLTTADEMEGIADNLRR